MADTTTKNSQMKLKQFSTDQQIFALTLAAFIILVILYRLFA
jgi:hypothetical protein